jgi:hypothetical protein
MKNKGHLYIYIQQVFGKDKKKIILNKRLLQHAEEELHVSRTINIFGLGKAREVIE